MDYKLPYFVNNVLDTLIDSGHKAYVVGGCVRDMIMGKSPKDWDVCTNALCEQVKKTFSHTVDTGIKFGTVTVIIDNEKVEVTTFRKDGNYSDSRRPDDVILTNDLQEDLMRRDFTINAMCYNHQSGILDCYGGMDDINAKLVRCVGESGERFKEDALRMLRAVRFASQLDFDIEKNTKIALIKNAHLLKKISMERINAELTGILLSDSPEGIMLLRELSLAQYISPLLNIVLAEFINSHKLKAAKNDIAHKWCVLLTMSSVPGSALLKALKYDKKTAAKVQAILGSLKNPVRADITEIKKMLRELGLDYTREAFELYKVIFDIDTKRHYELLNEILQNNECYSLANMAVKGHDLSKLDLRGKQVGEVLVKLLEMVIADPKLNTKEQLMNISKEIKKENYI